MVRRAFKDWTISRVNFARALAGVPGNTLTGLLPVQCRTVFGPTVSRGIPGVRATGMA